MPLLVTEHSKVYFGSNLDVLPTLEDNSVDSIVTDPPYELGFMGKSWDSSGIAYNVELWKECLRVLKPGGHLLAFSGSRTYHRMTVAIEDAGFEVRDMIAWISNKTFPKSLDVSKAIDKSLGAERKKIQTRMTPKSTAGKGATNNDLDARPWLTKAREQGFHEHAGSEPATPEAKQWEGWGTGLKPTLEPIVMARKPLIGTVAQNVLEHGTGALNIDGSRIGTEERTNQPAGSLGNSKTLSGGKAQENRQPSTSLGRWPANLILDEYSAEILDEQSGITKSGKSGVRTSDGFNSNSFGKGMGIKKGQDNGEYGDTGGASRFFYVARASKGDRSEGLETENNHPTVKPTALMTYLVNLVTPPNGTVLDPFTGSGSTGKAAIIAGFNFIGIELTEDYHPIIEGRLKHAEAKLTESKEKEGEALF